MKLKPIRRSIGMLLLFDGIRSFISPTGYPRKLEFGSPMIDDILDYFAEHPELTRKLSLAEIVTGVWLTLG